MSVVYAGDLSDAMSASAAINSLNADKEDAASMINALQDFISNTSGRLIGAGYDSVRNHLESYIGVLESRIRIADELIGGIKSACSSLLSYMDGESKLDTSELEMYYTKQTNLNNRLNSLESAIANYDPDEDEVDIGSLINAYNACELELKEVERMIALLEGLDAADSAAYGAYTGSGAGLSSLSGSVSGVSTISL